MYGKHEYGITEYNVLKILEITANKNASKKGFPSIFFKSLQRR